MNPKRQNNDKQLANLFNKAREVVLTDQEKASGRLKLMQFIDSNPPTGNEYMPDPVMWHVRLYRFAAGRKVYTAIGVAIFFMLLIGGSVSQAARGTLPGSPLYPWRISVNEKIKTFMAGSTEEKAQIEISQAASRLAEIEKLAVSGNLTTEKRVLAEQSFNSKIDNIIGSIDELKGKGDSYEAATVSGNLESMLLAHKNVIYSLPDNERKSDNLAVIESKVTNALIESVDRRSETEYVASQDEGLDKVRTRALSAKIDTETALSNAKKNFETSSAELKKSEGEEDTSLAHYKNAVDYHSEATSKLNSGNYGEAIVLYGKAHRNAEQAAIQREAEKMTGIRIKPVKPVSKIAPSGVSSTTVEATTSENPDSTSSQDPE